MELAQFLDKFQLKQCQKRAYLICMREKKKKRVKFGEKANEKCEFEDGVFVFSKILELLGLLGGVRM